MTLHTEELDCLKRGVKWWQVGLEPPRKGYCRHCNRNTPITFIEVSPYRMADACAWCGEYREEDTDE